MMNPCRWLAKNGLIFRQKFDARNGMAARPFNDSELRLAEYELIRMTRIISRHRRTCPTCLFNENALATEQRTLRPLPGEILASQQVH